VLDGEAWQVRPLAVTDVPRAATLLAAALDDDPAYRFLFPHPAERTRGLRDLFARNLHTHLPYRCTSVALDGDRLVGTVTFRPPGGFAISVWTMLRRGLIPFGLAHGTSAVRRLFALKETYDDLENRLSRGERHWYVHMMAVDPQAQGRGIGARLLHEVLSQTADAVGSVRAPAVLTTHKERNVVFYKRAGFEVDDVRAVSLMREPSYRVWSMRRPLA
jgi:GNAT superfamily N-acetyltransferase